MADDLRLTEQLRPGDDCEFRYPAFGGWRPGVVIKNGGYGYWWIEDDATGKIVRGCYIEHVRATGTDPWER